jgi:uncharacterized RDD family membrane protein YckC
MVYRDLFSFQPEQNSSDPQQPATAFIVDRFIAFILDFLIFSPIVSLCTAGLVRQMKTILLLNAQSTEALLVWGLLGVLMFFMVSGLQAVFLYFWQATPGQMFLQLRVISYPTERERLTIGQCWQRGIFWTLSILFIFPFVEILSHPLRRAFYDRASDTMVITLKKIHDIGPMPIESRFISSWMRLFFLLCLFMGTMTFFSQYPKIRGTIAQETLQGRGLLCDESRLEGLQGDQRLDTAFALYLLNSVTPECLSKEADAQLWTNPAGDRELAYLAKAMTTSDEATLEKYEDELCAKDTEVCQLSEGLLNTESGASLASTSLLSSQVVTLEQFIQDKDFKSAMNQIKALRETALGEALEKKYVKLMLAMMEKNGSQDRTPASVETQEWIKEFKESYDLK